MADVTITMPLEDLKEIHQALWNAARYMEDAIADNDKLNEGYALRGKRLSLSMRADLQTVQELADSIYKDYLYTIKDVDIAE